MLSVTATPTDQKAVLKKNLVFWRSKTEKVA